MEMERSHCFTPHATHEIRWQWHSTKLASEIPPGPSSEATAEGPLHKEDRTESPRGQTLPLNSHKAKNQHDSGRHLTQVIREQEAVSSLMLTGNVASADSLREKRRRAF